MFIVFPIIGATVLVTLGYFAMWTSSQANTPKGISQFGKVMSIILFCLAGLVIIVAVTFAPVVNRIIMSKVACMESSRMQCRMGIMADDMHKMDMKCGKEQMKPIMKMWMQNNPTECLNCMKEIQQEYKKEKK